MPHPPSATANSKETDRFIPNELGRQKSAARPGKSQSSQTLKKKTAEEFFCRFERGKMS
jgi:hypothetical protein